MIDLILDVVNCVISDIWFWLDITCLAHCAFKKLNYDVRTSFQNFCMRLFMTRSTAFRCYRPFQNKEIGASKKGCGKNCYAMNVNKNSQSGSATPAWFSRAAYLSQSSKRAILFISRASTINNSSYSNYRCYGALVFPLSSSSKRFNSESTLRNYDAFSAQITLVLLNDMAASCSG